MPNRALRWLYLSIWQPASLFVLSYHSLSSSHLLSLSPLLALAVPLYLLQGAQFLTQRRNAVEGRTAVAAVA